MIPIGQPYRPEGTVDARSLLSATILGVVAAVAAAAGVWLWEISPIPTLVVVTPLIQGVAVGVILALLIGRLRLRHPKLMGVVGLACGLASVGLVHYAHHLHLLDRVEQGYRAEVAADPELTPERRQELLAGAGGFADQAIRLKTGHGGFLGSTIFRSQVGFQLKHTHVAGAMVWCLWGVEALVVAALAALMAGTRAGEPFCEDCGDWCSKAVAPIEVAGESAPARGEAVRADDLQGVGRLLGEPASPEHLATHAARATLHACPGCDQAFADVECVLNRQVGKKTETKTTAVLRRVRVSPEMVALLREPASAAVDAEREAAPRAFEPAGA